MNTQRSIDLYDNCTASIFVGYFAAEAGHVIQVDEKAVLIVDIRSFLATSCMSNAVSLTGNRVLIRSTASLQFG